MGKVPCNNVVKLSTLVVPPPRHRTRRHQFTLCVAHEIFEECIHSRHVLGVGLRIPDSSAIGISVEIAPQEDALVFALSDTFG